MVLSVSRRLTLRFLLPNFVLGSTKGRFLFPNFTLSSGAERRFLFPLSPLALQCLLQAINLSGCSSRFLLTLEAFMF
jgi:hypothetical protein